MTYWLIEPNTGRALAEAKAKAATYDIEVLNTLVEPAPMVVDTEGTAYISVEGVLTKNRDPIAAFFMGANTAYRDLVAQVKAAASDPTIKRISMFVDSGGGMVDGLFEALDAISAAAQVKPISVTSDNAHSAAFAIASVAGNIQATSRGAMFGSVGVATTYFVEENAVTLTSTEAPDKRPDVTTEEGREAVVAQLDAIHDLFVGQIAQGRGTTPEIVNASFGRGASFVAEEALSRGMIDSIAQPRVAAVSDFEAKESKHMDISELKASHPELCEALRAEGVEEGIRKERDRVNAHLNMGEGSGDLATAHKAIRDGEELTQGLLSVYLAAGMKTAEIGAREADSVVSEEATAGVATTEATFEDRFIAEFDRLGDRDHIFGGK
jgi:ClpP class serine protease